MRGTDAELLRWSALVAVFLAVSTAVFCHIEGWGVFKSFYYAFCTSTTAGFGDVVVSPENRLIASVFMMIGATLVLSLGANVGQWILDTVTRRRSVRRFVSDVEDFKLRLRELGPDTSELEAELDRLMDDASLAMRSTDADDLDLDMDIGRSRCGSGAGGEPPAVPLKPRGLARTCTSCRTG